MKDYYRRTIRFVLCDSRHIRVHTNKGSWNLKGPEKFQRAGEEETNRNSNINRGHQIVNSSVKKE